MQFSNVKRFCLPQHHLITAQFKALKLFSSDIEHVNIEDTYMNLLQICVVESLNKERIQGTYIIVTLHMFQ